MTPAVVIIFPLEAAPIVEAAWSTDAEGTHMVDWLDQHADCQRVIDSALALAERERAA